MKKGMSLYLDVIRFSAALLVFFEHFRERTKRGLFEFWTDHPFLYGHLFPYGYAAVIVFFVLSGFVIAHVMATRERTPLEFAASRFARLYSVAFPALLLVAAASYLETLKYPHAFDAYGDRLTVFFDYLRSWFFVSNFWISPQIGVAGAPFWSLSLEAAYYVGIALFLFAPGRIRFLALAALCLAAGPTMILLAPTWLIGYGAYQFTQRRRMATGTAAILWLVSVFLLLLCPLIEIHMHQPLPFLRTPAAHVGGLLASYAVAICFTANIITFNDFCVHVEPLFKPFVGLIRWLGSITFALYMFHMPILSLFSAYPIGGRGSLTWAMVMIGGTLLIVATIGRFCERSKGHYKRGFLWVWEKLHQKAPPPAAVGSPSFD
jgi:peptidoglycan/LPS O-acetylase OafA/YrhL